MKLFAPKTTKSFGETVARALGQTLGSLVEQEFEDGEHKLQVAEDVRGHDVYAIQSLYAEPGQSVNDKLVRLLFLIGALQAGGARRVTAVIPYLAYARQDSQTKPGEPVGTLQVAKMLEAAGVDAVVTLDVHNLAAYQNAFRCKTWHLDTRELFVDHILGTFAGENLVVASPDVGGIKRAQLFLDTLAARTEHPVGFAFMEKRRNGGVLSGSAVVGEVAGATAIIFDDMIASGGTMARAADAFQAHGASRVLCMAAHGLFVGGAPELLGRGGIDRFVVTDTVAPFRSPADLIAARIEVVSAAQLFADAIRLGCA